MTFRKYIILLLLAVMPAGLCVAADYELENPTLEADSDEQHAPNGWRYWAEEQMELERDKTLSEGASWKFWYDSGIWQPISGLFRAGTKLKFGGYFMTPSDDRLRNGMKNGNIALEFYDAREQGNMIHKVSASPTVNETSSPDKWFVVEAIAIVPPKTRRIQFVVRCEDGDSGDGSFFVDDVFLKEYR
ncbi:MAG: hypothetical protein EOM20_17250 [Spartobacteria bacterium]|nr:hypothetical protein [Spartobacteria bacterium]